MNIEKTLSKTNWGFAYEYEADQIKKLKWGGLYESLRKIGNYLMGFGAIVYVNSLKLSKLERNKD